MGVELLEKTLKKKLAKYSNQQIYAFMNDERRRKGLSDLYYHNKYVLGYADMVEHAHRPLCDFIQSWNTGKTKKLIVGPRDCFKSSADVIGYSTQLIAQDPMVKIFITSEIVDNAKAYLSAIQRHITGNSVYRETYSHLGSDYVISVLNTECLSILPIKEQKRVSEKEHTVDVGGIGTVDVGMHYDYIFFVDPHSQRNINTKEQIEKVIVYYKLLNSIKKANTGKMIIEMNRWTFVDLANHLLENEKDLFDFWIQSAYNPDGSLFFPERLSAEYLAEKLKELGTFLYSALYLAAPRSDKDKIFKPEIATYYDTAPANLEKWLFADPSISEKENADDFPLMVLGINRSNNDIYILDSMRVNRKMPTYAIPEMVLMFKRNFQDQPKFRAGIESVAFQRIYKFELERELSREGKSFEVIELKPEGRAKKARITGLQPFYEAGKIKLRAGQKDRQGEVGVSPDLDVLFQLEKFPFGKDDYIDLLAYVLDLIRPHREPNPLNRGITHHDKMRIAGTMRRQSALKRRYG